METEVLRRLVVIGDIHSEDRLLEAAIDAVSHLNADAIVCTGDVVDGSGSAERCCDLLRAHKVLVVRGNHDRWVFTGVLRDMPGSTRLDELSRPNQALLRQLPPTRELAIPGGLMLLCHGIGSSDLEKITDFDSEYSLQVNQALQAVIAGAKYRLMVNGHSHARIVLKVGPLSVVNAGALCHQSDPGFLLLDFDQNLVQWYALGNGSAVPSDQRPIF